MTSSSQSILVQGKVAMDETRDDSYEMKTFPTHDGSFVGGDSSSDCSSKHESSTEEPDDALLAMKRMRKAHDPSYDRKEERVILKKLDRNLVLFLALLYMLSFLDRSSILINMSSWVATC